MSNNRALLVIAVLFVAVVTFHFYSKKEPSANETEGLSDAFKRPTQWQGRYAPDFEMEFIDGRKFRLSEHIGKKVIVLNFFATWCGPCREEMPELNKFHEAHKNASLILVGINSNENAEKVGKFAQDFGLTFPIGIDATDNIQKMYGVRSYPTTVLIGADGKVQTYEVGQITNADISFGALYKAGMEIINAGNGIGKEEYLKNTGSQVNLKTETAEKDKSKLEGRAGVIAGKMNCPCGCNDIVADCNCKTAKDIKERLRKMDLSAKTDEEIILDLNREFCVKGRKSGHDKS